MKNSSYFVLVALLCLFSCSGDDDPQADPCQTNAPQISNAVVSNASCGLENGSISITATGGKGPYQYSLNNATFQADNTFNGLASGNYSISIKDANGCSVVQQRSITEESDMQLSGAVNAHAGCGSSNGSITLTAAGGSGIYSYSINGTDFQSGAQFANMAAGEYTLTAKDERGCATTSTLKVPSGISFDASVKSIVETNCAITGCHVSGTGRQNFTQFATIKSNAANIKAFTQAGTMPPASSGKTLTADQKQAIACWVDDGGENN